MAEEELDVKIGSKVEAFWTKQLKGSENVIEQCKNEIMLQEELCIVAKRKIKEEQRLSRVIG